MCSLGQSARLLLKSNTGNSKSIGGIIVGGRSIGYDRKVVMKAQLIITHPGSAHFDEVVSFMGAGQSRGRTQPLSRVGGSARFVGCIISSNCGRLRLIEAA